ncbi:hypothetical protein ACIO6T_39610 [Streptomyces sp. NPDC087532]|uniref:hypothetical protein n=1 Tax=Streptomyces sp. NPDC087532 TaxID=3365795 RepID=UPI0037FE1936
MLRTPVIAWIAVVMGAVRILVALLLAAAPGIALHQYQKTETDLSTMWTAAAVVTLLATSVTHRGVDRWWMALLLIATGIALAAASATAGTVETFAAFAVAPTAIVAAECVANVVLRTMRLARYWYQHPAQASPTRSDTTALSLHAHLRTGHESGLHRQIHMPRQPRSQAPFPSGDPLRRKSRAPPAPREAPGNQMSNPDTLTSLRSPEEPQP